MSGNRRDQALGHPAVRNAGGKARKAHRQVTGTLEHHGRQVGLDSQDQSARGHKSLATKHLAVKGGATRCPIP